MKVGRENTGAQCSVGQETPHCPAPLTHGAREPGHRRFHLSGLYMCFMLVGINTIKCFINCTPVPVELPSIACLSSSQCLHKCRCGFSAGGQPFSTGITADDYIKQSGPEREPLPRAGRTGSNASLVYLFNRHP